MTPSRPIYPWPRSGRISKPHEWGHGVSVCIAILSNDSRNIVAVTDEKITFGDGSFSSERAALKNTIFAPNWFALYAGNDAAHVPPILARAEKTLMKGGAVLDHTAEEVGKAVDDAYAFQLRQHIENSVLRKYGFTIESFLNEGKRKLSSSVYNRICAQVERTSLSLVFLVCGFDPNGQGHIMAIDGESAIQSFDEVGFAAIGEGDRAALSALAFQIGRMRLAPRYSTIGLTAYCALEAKFMAETASTVGESTFCVVWERNVPPRHISWRGIKTIRQYWERHGAPRLPDAAEELASDMIFWYENEGKAKTDAAIMGKRLPRSANQGAEPDPQPPILVPQALLPSPE